MLFPNGSCHSYRPLPSGCQFRSLVVLRTCFVPADGLVLACFRPQWPSLTVACFTRGTRPKLPVHTPRPSLCPSATTSPRGRWETVLWALRTASIILGRRGATGTTSKRILALIGYWPFLPGSGGGAVMFIWTAAEGWSAPAVWLASLAAAALCAVIFAAIRIAIAYPHAHSDQKAEQDDAPLSLREQNAADLAAMGSQLSAAMDGAMHRLIHGIRRPNISCANISQDSADRQGPARTVV